MSQPLKKSYTVFVVEGIKIAVVVADDGTGLAERRKRFESPAAALAWCRKKRARMIYSPAENVSQN
jgi:hypothetical protein